MEIINTYSPYLLLFVFSAVFGYVIHFVRSGNGQNKLSRLEGELEAQNRLLLDLKEQLRQKEQQVVGLSEQLSKSEQGRATAETRLEESIKNFKEKQKLLEDAEAKLTTTFQAISGETLKSNSQVFIEQAKEAMGSLMNKAKGEMGEKGAEIKNVVSGLDVTLKKYESYIKELEEKRGKDYGSLDAQIKSLLNMSQSLQKETGNLVTALRRPEVRGRWGEVTLKRVVELAGMTEHCDFEEQVSVTHEGGRLRPDMIIHLPAGREIVVDSKVSLEAYLGALETDDEDQKKVFLLKHAQQIRNHMKDLAGKGYWEQFPNAPEFVVMFIPGESFLSAALDKDPMLIEDGMQSKVILATPTTFVSLLRAIAFGWRQEQVAKNAKEIAALAKEIYDRFQPFVNHLNKTGDYLTQATGSYNKMVSSLERRVMVSVRKFKELGVVGDKELNDTKSIEQQPVQSTLLYEEVKDSK